MEMRVTRYTVTDETLAASPSREIIKMFLENWHQKLEDSDKISQIASIDSNYVLGVKSYGGLNIL